MRCWKCRQLLQDLAGQRLSFRAICEHCGCDLHCCKGCRFHAPGKPNECAVPNTELITDRQAANFCEEFAPLLEHPSTWTSSKEDIEKRLFGRPSDDPPQGRFDDLFS